MHMRKNLRWKKPFSCMQAHMIVDKRLVHDWLWGYVRKFTSITISVGLFSNNTHQHYLSIYPLLISIDGVYRNIGTTQQQLSSKSRTFFHRKKKCSMQNAGFYSKNPIKISRGIYRYTELSPASGML